MVRFLAARLPCTFDVVPELSPTAIKAFAPDSPVDDALLTAVAPPYPVDDINPQMAAAGLVQGQVAVYTQRATLCLHGNVVFGHHRMAAKDISTPSDNIQRQHVRNPYGLY